jgi:glycine/D-amino acid oxidase-like deaminating enzyme
VKWDPDRCDDSGDYSGGRWIPAEGVDDDDETYFVVRTADGKKSGAITQIIVWDPSIQTKSGAHIGSTRDELEDLFPKLKKIRSEGEISGLYSVSDNSGRVIFETMEHTVVDIIVQQRDVEPFGVQFTDAGGFCTG